MENSMQENSSPHLLLRKDPDDNICNLCLSHHDSLSEEHVPPRCSGNNGTGRYFSCFPELQPVIENEIYTDGVSYLTVCKVCNKKLGDLYDRDISKLFGTVRHNQRDSNIVTVRVRPNSIMRGILGHFISAKTSHQLSVVDEDFRRCAIDPEFPIPNNYHFYIIYYPYKIIRIIRNIIMIPNLLDDLRVIMNVVKIDPLAFIVTDQPFLGSKFTDWNKYNFINWKREVNVKIPKNVTLPFNMPECDKQFSRLFGLNAWQSICATIDKRSK